VFDRLTAVRVVGVRRRRPFCRLWLCRCVCGRETVAATNVLTNGNKRSCGCLVRPVEHVVGIKVAAAAVALGLSPNTIYGRINHGGMRPAVAISTPRIRRGRQLTFRGETRNLSGWARLLGISREAMRLRLRSRVLTRAEVFTARGFDVVAASALKERLRP